MLKGLHKQAQEPEKLARLLEVHHESLGHNIVRRAEEAKIALSDQTAYRTGIQLFSERVDVDVSRDNMIDAIEAPKRKMIALVHDVVAQAGVKPDVIFYDGWLGALAFLTGGCTSRAADYSCGEWRLFWLSHRRLSALGGSLL